MTTFLLLPRAMHHLPLPRIAYQRNVPIDAVDELAIRHRDEQREHHAEMQRQQRAHRSRIAQQQQRDAGQAGQVIAYIQYYNTAWQ